ncbi:MAG: biphenyl 2,3-dioxygenase [Candidatus Methylomirabilales bacterium]
MNLPRALTRWMIASLGFLAVLPLLLPSPGFGGPPKAMEVRVETGSKQGLLRFFPSRLQFTRGTYYKLLIHNPSPDAHYFTSDGFVTRIFTRKVEVLDARGETLVEIHGDIREVELLPGQTVAWYFYPMTKGKHLKLYCHKKGHEEGGMVGQIEISGPPPFTGQ